MKLLQRTATDSHEKELISGTQKDAWQWRKPAVLNHQGTTRDSDTTPKHGSRRARAKPGKSI